MSTRSEVQESLTAAQLARNIKDNLYDGSALTKELNTTLSNKDGNATFFKAVNKDLSSIDLPNLKLTDVPATTEPSIHGLPIVSGNRVRLTG